MESVNTEENSLTLETPRPSSYKSKWFIPTEISFLLKEVRPGDALEFNRGYINHWGIYIGKARLDLDYENAVVHAFIPGESFFSPSSNFFITSRFGNVLNSSSGYVDCHELNKVWNDSKVRINNSKDNNHTPHQQLDIVQKAIDAIGIYEDYSLLKNNCEHFVNFCRYGVKSCDQLRNGVQLMSVFGGALTVMYVIGRAILMR